MARNPSFRLVAAHIALLAPVGPVPEPDFSCPLPWPLQVDPPLCNEQTPPAVPRFLPSPRLTLQPKHSGLFVSPMPLGPQEQEQMLCFPGSPCPHAHHVSPCLLHKPSLFETDTAHMPPPPPPESHLDRLPEPHSTGTPLILKAVAPCLSSFPPQL